jgi:hypothetical protein
MKSKRAKEVRGEPAQNLSADCRNGHHSFCSGQRYLAPHKSAAVGRCKCKCHG